MYTLGIRVVSIAAGLRTTRWRDRVYACLIAAAGPVCRIFTLVSGYSDWYGKSIGIGIKFLRPEFSFSEPRANVASAVRIINKKIRGLDLLN